ncbi:hypothetical protein SAPIO_CDS3239 [Scedosporium apiospermum]|uniref:C2H2-type domain-containing protein n=1 Tax=Pseudallescheria apiosperma TaxID=563466 RepID=A0A084GAC2_PSEDA|nr:uncharacterized protein SAPIO_CDS3239 [Scedosporium apiospermum]KEZ44284.1 hypothetical protein SAPIO_CDS3239 [Scedosporium apiospermum]
MTLTLDTNQRYGPLNFDPSYPSSASPPQFSDPWSSTPAPSVGNNIYASSNHSAHHHHQTLNPGMGMNCMPRHHNARTSTSSVSSSASYASMPVPATSAGKYPDPLNAALMDPVYGEPSYASSSPVHAHYPAPTSPYDNLAYTQNPIRPPFTLPPAPDARRFSQPALQHHDRRGYPDAMDASHGLLSMSQETPRNIYAPPRAQRGSADSYGFPPTTHSTNSSISSTSNFSTYRESSLSDYSAMGSDMDLSRTRTLPRPQNLMTSQVPPAPQSLMSQFSSKVSSSTQKKHKCKVCDKRFTRPSSLQTHMYSHTGEKPYACEVEGCGKHFSVVSNLRRHQKVHKGEARSETGSEEHQSE